MTATLPAIDPRHTALLVMDYQNGLLRRLSEADALLARMADAIAAVRSHEGQIGYVRVAFEDADYDAIPGHSAMAAAVAGRPLHSDSPATATLILAGISTSGVVLSTVRDAADRDYQVLVLADATTDPEPGVHEFLTEKIFPRQAHVITIAELKDLLSAPGAGA